MKPPQRRYATHMKHFSARRSPEDKNAGRARGLKGINRTPFRFSEPSEMAWGTKYRTKSQRNRYTGARRYVGKKTRAGFKKYTANYRQYSAGQWYPRKKWGRYKRMPAKVAFKYDTKKYMSAPYKFVFNFEDIRSAANNNNRDPRMASHGILVHHRTNMISGICSRIPMTGGRKIWVSGISLKGTISMNADTTGFFDSVNTQTGAVHNVDTGTADRQARDIDMVAVRVIFFSTGYDIARRDLTLNALFETPEQPIKSEFKGAAHGNHNMLDSPRMIKSNTFLLSHRDGKGMTKFVDLYYDINKLFERREDGTVVNSRFYYLAVICSGELRGNHKLLHRDHISTHNDAGARHQYYVPLGHHSLSMRMYYRNTEFGFPPGIQFPRAYAGN